MSKSLDDVVKGALMHGAHPYDKSKYDPVKAHEYYMRTRELKGRRKGRADTNRSGSSLGKSKPAASSSSVSPSAQKQIDSLKSRLAELQARLREILANKRESSSSKDDKKTAAEKSKDARESKDYREKHKAEIAQKAKKAAKKSGGSSGGSSGGLSSMSEDQVRAAITKVRANLQAAIANARR